VVVLVFKAGDQLPVILFNDVVGSGDNAAPEQIGATGLKVGVTGGPTLMVKLVVVAHWPAAGVNV
jgi:hypothetical protein